VPPMRRGLGIGEGVVVMALNELRQRRERLVHEGDIYLRFNALTGERTFKNWSRGVAWFLLGMVKTPGQAKNVAVAGDVAFVADHVRGVDVVRLTSPAAPTLAGSQFVDGFAKDVVARGHFLYAIDQPNGLNVFDIANPAAVTLTGSSTLTVPIPLRAQLDVSDSASPRLAVVVGGGPVQIYDVSDPKAAKVSAIYRTPGAAQRVQLKGSDLYVADGPAGLQLVDLATPSAPTIAASFQTPMPARDVAVSGPLVFVVSGPEVLILRRSN